ncbi:hypothetical protein K7X08_005796 [Anisodus acutangulus]|uniref:Uncharacterized protein n=1 Tax=Anisodus acutangulus TaxID=402998 RepID=A0A9Q1R5B8_9SOLA|nr:hypothetical protein K7X08_005796 [Anisodus acutangulus]
MEEYSKSNKKSHNNQINLQENQKLMIKINSIKNGSGIGCLILLGVALITAAAMGSAFLIGRKSTKKITKKVENEKIEDESCKGLHFLLPDSSSPCIEQQPPSSNGTDKLCDNDSTSLLSTPSLIQDEKTKLGTSDEKRDTLNAIVSEHSKEEENSPSCDKLPVHEEELVLSETKISLLPDPDQELNEVSEARIEVIQGNEKTEVLAQQLTDTIEIDNHEEGLIQEQEKQATGDQETINLDDNSLQVTSTSNEHEPLNTAFELMKAADEDEDKEHMRRNGLKENEDEESVFVNEEGEEDDDYANNIDKDDDAQEVEDDILEGATNSSDQSNSDKMWAADSNQDLLLELKEKKVKEEEEAMKIKEDETCNVENCNLKSTQDEVAIPSCQQSYDGKEDSAVNVIERYQMKLMYLDDVVAIISGRRVLLGALLVLIWYLCLNAFYL